MLGQGKRRSVDIGGCAASKGLMEVRGRVSVRVRVGVRVGIR